MSQVVTRRKRKAKRAGIPVGRLAEHRLEIAKQWDHYKSLPHADVVAEMQKMIDITAFELCVAHGEISKLTPGVCDKPWEPVSVKMNHELWISVDENGNRIVDSNYWIKRADYLLERLFKMVEVAQKLGMTDRLTRAKEAEVGLLGEALQAAAKRIGLPVEQQRELGAALRTELAVIEGKAHEM